MIYGTVLCVGDSLLTGARDEVGLSVPHFLSEELSVMDQEWVAVDEGVNGETTGTLLRRFYRTVRAYPEAPDVVLCVGTNDAKGEGVPAEYFCSGYCALLKTTMILKKHCYACTIPERNGYGAPDYINNGMIRAYNGVIKDLVEGFWKSTATLVDLRKVPAACRDDGVHFNLEGDKWAATKIASVILKTRS